MLSSVLQDLATGIRLSLLILGWRDWLKVLMLTLNPEYFLQGYETCETSLLGVNSPYYLVSVLVSVEAVHQDQRHVAVVLLV